MSADLCFATDSFFFFRRLRARGTALNETRPVGRKVSAIWKRTSKIWGIFSAYKSGVEKPPLDDFAT